MPSTAEVFYKHKFVYKSKESTETILNNTSCITCHMCVTAVLQCHDTAVCMFSVWCNSGRACHLCLAAVLQCQLCVTAVLQCQLCVAVVYQCHLCAAAVLQCQLRVAFIHSFIHFRLMCNCVAGCVAV